MGYLSDEEIMDGIRSGDDRVFNTISRMMRPEVISMAAAAGLPYEEGEDLLQDTLSAILVQVRDKGYQLKGRFRNLFMSVSRNLLSNKLQKRSVEKRHLAREPEPSYGHDPEERIDRDARKQAINEVLDKLVELCRNIILFSMQGMDLKVIAGRLGKNHNYIRRRKVYCYARFYELASAHPVLKDYTYET
jgi:RNA polymerase sigma factor (sigma-70 family)